MKPETVQEERDAINRVILKAATYTAAPLLDTPDPWRDAAMVLFERYDQHLKTHLPQPKRINA